MDRPSVFISYSHDDEAEKNQLLAHLGVLQKAGLISVWVDDRISGGADWEEEIAKAMGARVIAAASSDKKLEFAVSAGADETINYSDVPLNETVKELTDGKGADVVYDPVGGELAEQAFRATAWHGRYLVIGFACGEIPKFSANIALLKEASIVGVWWGTWAGKNPKTQMQNMMEMAALIADGTLTPRVTESFALDDYKNAFRTITERRALGKVTLRI